MLPIAIKGTGPHGEIETNVSVKTADELTKALLARGLPPIVFGIDEPPAIDAPMKLIEQLPVTENHPGQTVTENGSGNFRDATET